MSTTLTVLREELAALGHGEGIAGIQPLEGGWACDSWLVSYADGTRVVGKTLAGAPADLFQVEAYGLDALRATGHVRTPGVLAVTSGLLLLEYLPPRPDTEESWAALAVGLANMHRATAGDRFGWVRDGYLGRSPQRNAWSTNGHEFFAEHRLLRYVAERRAQRALTAGDRQALERFCARLPDIVPAMPSVLTHGDLWSANVLGHPGGGLAVIDPAVSRTWAEVDLSMLWCSPRPPASERFFAVYQEVNPSPSGWAERMPLLYLRELLSVIAQEDNSGYAVDWFRKLLAPFYSRPPTPRQAS